MTEAALEAKCVAIAATKGWMAFKGETKNARGRPDRLFLGPDHSVLIVEFKQPGEKPTKLQEKIHKKIRELDFEVYVVDNVQDFVKALRIERYWREDLLDDARDEREYFWDGICR